MKFAANISTLFGDVGFLERPASAAAAGFGAVEFWWPARVALGELADALRASDVAVALVNFDGGNLAAGDRGLLSSPATVDAFLDHVPVALAFAQSVGCRCLNALVGLRDAAIAPAEQEALAIASVRWAADRAAELGMDVLIEPINARDVPRYLLPTISAAVGFIAAVDRPNVKLQYDCYHAQRGEGNLLETIEENIASIGHVQVADAPGRSEPGTGEINVCNVLATLTACGYDGYVGLEYVPSGPTESGLAWLPQEMRNRDVDIFSGNAAGATNTATATSTRDWIGSRGRWQPRPGRNPCQ
jgi:hydroxypyruvate isomerase